MLMSMMSINSFAYDIKADNADGVTIYYKYGNDGKELVVTSNNNRYRGDIVIPELVEYSGKTYPVTSIGDNAFLSCTELTSVAIPNSVKTIGKSAFSSCTSLTSITIPNSVTSLGYHAFYLCRGLTSINLSNNMTSIGNCAFQYCSGLTSIIIPNSVTTIGYRAFNWCSSLTSVTLPNSVISIGNEAFYDCGGLVTLYSEIEKPFEVGSFIDILVTLIVPVGTKTAYQSTVGWNKFTRIVETGEGGLAGSVFEIDGLYYTIGENSTASLTSTNESISGAVTIPSQVEFNEKKYVITSIGNYVFYDRTGLTYITIPNSITSIGNFTFYGCTSLPSIIIPNSVTSIGEGAFGGCSGLTSVTIPNSVTFVNNKVFLGCSSLTSITIPNSVTSIGDYSFRDCSGLTSITIPNSVTNICDGAFYNCSGLSSIIIPDGVTSIGKYAFFGCNSLISAIIGSSVCSIGNDAFRNLKKTIWLTNTLPSGYNNASGTVNYVSNDQFNIGNMVVYKFLSSNFVVDGIRYVPVSPSDHTCDAVDCIYDESAEYINIGETVTNKGVNLTVEKANPYICYGNKNIKKIKFGLSGDIGNYAFYGCSNLESVEFGQNVQSIGFYAFSDCSKLKNIVIPDPVTSLGSYAFQNCATMTSVKIGNGIETINEYTFSGCSSLKNIYFSSKVKTIGQYVFDSCSSLQEISIPQAVTTIEDYVFSNCTSLKRVIIDYSESTLTLGSNGPQPLFSTCPLESIYIGRDISYKTSSNYGYSPFYRNTSLHSVEITDSETEISENEFYGCTNLQQVKIGDGVTTIGNWSFSGCSSLKYFAFGSQLTTIGQNAFSDCAALIEISSKAKAPPECGNQALDDINKWECRLFVPEGCYDIYKSAEQWKEFFFIEEGESSIYDIPSYKEMDIQIQCNGSLLTIIGADVGTTISVFDIEGRPVGTIKASAETTTINTSLQIGDIGIVKIGDKVVKVLMK